MSRTTIRKYPRQQLESQPSHRRSNWTHTYLSVCDKHLHTVRFYSTTGHTLYHMVFLNSEDGGMLNDFLCFVISIETDCWSPLLYNQHKSHIAGHTWRINSHMHKRTHTVILSRNTQLFSIPCPPWTDGNIDSRSRGNKRGNRVVMGDDGGLGAGG